MTIVRWNWRSAGAILLGVAIYAGFIGWILASNTAKLYGFSVQPGIHDLLGAVSQICPLFAAIVFLTLDTSARKLVGPILSPFLLAGVFTAAVMGVVLWICHGSGAGLSGLAQGWSYLGLLADLLLVALFTSFLRWLSGGPVLAMVLFLGYVVAIFYLGPTYGMTAFIGFGSTPPCSLTVYSDEPLGYQQAWLFRMYWALCVAVMVALRYDARLRFRQPYRVVLALAVFSIAASMIWKQTHVKPLALPVQEAGQSSGRPVLTDYKLHLNYLPQERRVVVEGELQFKNTTGAPLSTLWLEAPHLVTLGALTFNQSVKVDQTGLYRKVTLANPLNPGGYLVLNYSGEIHATDAAGRALTQAKLLDASFFLFHSDLLFAARRPGCLDGKGSDCGGGTPLENYLLVDRATGQITVQAPPGWVPVSVGDQESSNGGRTTFITSEPRVVSFLVACARFTQAHVAGVSVFQSQNNQADSVKIGTIARGILDFYESTFPKLATSRDLRVVVTPSRLGEAIAFEGLLAVSDRVIDSRATDNSGPSNMVEFVMAHELAHQWWGYQLVPARAPGRAFAVESFAQFSAYCYAANRKILTEDQAVKNEEKNYHFAKAHMADSPDETPLAQLDKEDYLAYHKGPFVLLSLDALDGYSLLSSMGGILQKYARNGQEAVPPRAIVEDLLSSLKPEAQAQGREWLLQAKTDGQGS